MVSSFIIEEIMFTAYFAYPSCSLLRRILGLGDALNLLGVVEGAEGSDILMSVGAMEECELEG